MADFSVLSVTPADASLGQRDRLVVAGFCDDASDEAARASGPGYGGRPVPASWRRRRCVRRLSYGQARSTGATRTSGCARPRSRPKIGDGSTRRPRSSTPTPTTLSRRPMPRSSRSKPKIKGRQEGPARQHGHHPGGQGEGAAPHQGLEGDADELKLTTFQRRRAVRAEMDEKLDAIAKRSRRRLYVTPLITLRWSVTA